MKANLSCNVCGKRLDAWDKQEDFTILRRLGYGTRHDGERLTLRFCCECMDKLIDGCKINPTSSIEPNCTTGTQ